MKVKHFNNFNKFLLANFTLFSLSFFIFEANANGIIVPHQPQLQIPQLISYSLKVTIKHPVATVKSTQVFYNKSKIAVEGTYIFPLPNKIALRKFSLICGGKELVGEILDKEKAAEVYSQIVRDRKDPALLEYYGLGQLRARIFPIPPGSTRAIELTYEQIIEDVGLCKFIYPLRLPEGIRTPLDKLTIDLELHSRQPIQMLYSPTHEIDVVKRTPYNFCVTLEKKDYLLTQNFELFYALSKEDLGVQLLSYKEPHEDGYFLLLLAPSIEKKKPISKDVVFVIDTSGSMAGEKMENTKRALKFMVDNMNEHDRFDIMRFSTDIEFFQAKLVQPTEKVKEQAFNFIDNLVARGGTNIYDALLEALSYERLQEGRPLMIIFLTDGQPTVNVTDPEKILQKVRETNNNNARIFVLGIGYDVNAHFLDKLAGENRGTSEYIEREQDIELKVSNFYERISLPVLTDVDLKIEGIKIFDMYPKSISDIFYGQLVSILGRYKDFGKALIHLSGSVEDMSRNFRYEVSFEGNNLEYSYLQRLWAMRKIGYLLDQIRLHGEQKELIDEIKYLSKRYGIITPYTSFLVLEDEPSMYVNRDQLEASKQAYMTLHKQYSGEFAHRAAKSMHKLKTTHLHESIDMPNMRYVNSKTFYLREGVWVDSQYKEGMKLREVKFASLDYFELLKKLPHIGKILSLGKLVLVCITADEAIKIVAD